MFNSLELFTSTNMDKTKKDKLDRYLMDNTLKVDNPIKWWLIKSSLFPSLSCMALDYLSIPGKSRTIYFSQYFTTVTATSTDVEWVFLHGCLCLPHVRNQLNAKSTHAIICLGAWSLLGLVKDGDIQAVTKKKPVITAEDNDEGDVEMEEGWDNILDNF